MSKEIRYIRISLFLLIIGLTTLLVSSLLLNIKEEYDVAREYAVIEAKASYNKDLLYRRWAAMHGGVYVPVTDKTPPNPYLEFIEDRDIETESGKLLTLINPAYMTRQVFEIAEGQYGVKGHITSLNPIRTANKADEWETRALKMFEKGVSEYWSTEKINGVKHLRFMNAMIVEERCMKCHSQQGYKIGEVRGGVSVSVPLDKYDKTAREKIITLIITHVLIYLIVLILAIIGYKRIYAELISRNLIQQKVIESEASLQLQNKELVIAKERAEESDRLKTAFLTNMSHEIRTPMNAILGFSELLKKADLAESKKEKYINLITSGGRRLLHIISDIVEVSKIDAKQVTISYSSCCLNKMLDELFSIFSLTVNHSNIKLLATKGLQDDKCEIQTDCNRLVQILSNLIENAIKFTKEGSVEFGYLLETNYLKFYVADTGSGVKTEDQELIFERFRQSDQAEDLNSGTGLGLFIAKELVEMLGGQIWVESEIGKGSTFYFTIPYK